MSYKAKPGNFIIVDGNFPEIDKAINAFNDEWLTLHNSDEDLILYHYTTNFGLKGILQSRSIWFSNIKYFKDPQEWHYGKDIVVNQLEKSILKETEKEIIEILKGILEYFPTLSASIYHIYIACFCETDNLLSQWREYADAGGGYSLGISFDEVINYTHYIKDLSKKSFPLLRKVIYNPDCQNKLVEKFIRLIRDAAKKEIKQKKQNGGNFTKPPISEIAMKAINTIWEIIPCLKDSAFEKEDEWRLIQVLRSDHKVELLKFRESRGELIPYIQTYIYKSEHGKKVFPIKTMRCGPTLEKERTKSSLNLLIDSCVKSSTPINIIKKEVNIKDAGYPLRY